MPTNTKIAVTEPLILRACQRDSRHCMIAEAIQAARPHWKNISVDLATIRWTNPKTSKRYIALTPEAAGQALVKFDQGEDVEPFSLTITPVQEIALRRDKRGHQAPASPRQQQLVVDDHGRTTIVGGKPLPRGHLGGSPTGNQTKNKTRHPVQKTPEGNVQVSSGRYRQYGLRQLRG
jgi:hypothetical protein